MQLSPIVVLAYLEFLVKNNVSIHMIANHVSAIIAMAVVYSINYQIMDHPRIRAGIHEKSYSQSQTQI